MDISREPDAQASDFPHDTSRAARSYGMLLRAYPRHYRARFGSAMRDTFLRDHARVRAAGHFALLPFWIGTIVQACWFGACERARAARAVVRRGPVGVVAQTRALGAQPAHARGGRWAALTDLRYALRLLARSPLFTLTSVLSLAIGIAASTIVFSAADGLFLQASPGVRDADRLVDIARTTNGRGDGPILYASFQHLREHTRTLDGIAAVTRNPMPLSLHGDGSSVRVYGQTVSAAFFGVLRMQPTIGRFFHADEDRMDDPRPVVVVSHRFWRDHLGADPDVLRRPMRLNDIPFDVVGVAAEGFDGTTIIGADLWVPISMAAELQRRSRLLRAGPQRRDERPNAAASVDARRADAAAAATGADWNDERAIARLAPGVTREAAQAELNTLMAAAKADNPSIPPSHGIIVGTMGRLPPRARSTFGSFVGLLAVLAGGLLAIACSNVAGMMLARATTRRHEMATRLAMGASRGQLIGQLLVETLVLFAAGGVLALPLAIWLAGALEMFLPPNLSLPIRFELALTVRTAIFALGMALTTGLLFGLAPARHALGTNLSEMFHGRSATASRDRLRLRHGLVVVQVALSLAMVITAGLFVRTLQAASQMDGGYKTDAVTVIRIDTSLVDASGPEAVSLVGRLVERLRGLSHVEAVGHARLVPLEGNSISLGSVRTLDDTEEDRRRLGSVGWDIVSPEYFEVVGLPIVAGRAFTADDRDSRPAVAIVNETFARAAWPGRSAIGQRFWRVTQDNKDGFPVDVVGVARDARYRYVGELPAPLVYLAFAQLPQTRVELFVKHAPGVSIGKDARAAISGVESRLPVVVMRSFADATAVTLVPQRFAAWMAGTVGSIGIFLASLGLYGIVAFLVAQQTREIAIRMALGATQRDVRATVLGHASRLAVAGVALGLLLAWGLGRLVQRLSLLVGVQPTDPLTFVTLPLLMSAVLFAASYLPARRAAATDPAAALRAQ